MSQTTISTNETPNNLETLLDTLHNFTQTEVKKIAGAPLEAQRWAGESIRLACKQGLAGIEVPKELGGLGLTFHARVKVAEYLAHTDFAFSFAFINHHNAILRIAQDGSAWAKEHYIPALLNGDLIACTAMSEPNAGSDFSAITLKARKTKGGWLLNGSKQWICNAVGADLAIVFAQTDEGSGSAGIAGFIVELQHATCRRLPCGPLNGLTLAGIGGFSLDEHFVHEAAVLYPPGEGFRMALASVNKARVHIAAMASGLLRSALEQANTYCSTRLAFGQPIINFQGLRWSLVDAGLKHDVLQLLTDRATALIEEESPLAMDSAAAAKLYAGQETLNAIAQCIQAMGAAGLQESQGLSNKLLAAKALCLADGTNEMMLERLGATLAQRYQSQYPPIKIAQQHNDAPQNTSLTAASFKAVHLSRLESGETMAEIIHVPLSELPPGEVLVRVQHSTLNYKDALAITGKSPVVRQFPMIPGIDFAGTVEQSADDRFQPGDQVILNGWGTGELRWGGLAQYASTKADWLIPLPKKMTTEQAMSIGTAGYTAMLCVIALERHGIKPESGPILVTGANGGVGSIAIALLSQLGYLVTASTGRVHETEHLLSLGAQAVMDRSALSSPNKPLQKENWAAAIDCVGSHTLANVLASTRYGGIVAACGLAQGMDLPSTVAPFILRGVTLAGIDSVYAPLAIRKQAWERLSHEFPERHRISTVRTIGLTQVIPLAEQLLAGKIRGRLMVDVHA